MQTRVCPQLTCENGAAAPATIKRTFLCVLRNMRELHFSIQRHDTDITSARVNHVQIRLFKPKTAAHITEPYIRERVYGAYDRALLNRFCPLVRARGYQNKRKSESAS